MAALSKNRSNSNKIRIPDSSACSGFLSVPLNNWGKNARDGVPRGPFQPVPHQAQFLQAPARSSSFAQHTPAAPGAQVESRLPVPCAIDPAYANFFFCYS